MKTLELVKEPKPLTFEQFSAIIDRQQLLMARRATNAIDRAKTTVSKRDKFNRFAQLGNKLIFRNVVFTFESGSGLLIKADGKQVWGATLGDWLAEIEQVYGRTFKWA